MLSSDLHLEPIAPAGESLLDMVEDAAEEMLDTIPGTSRAELVQDPQRTAEMEKEQLAELLPKTLPPKGAPTIAQRPPLSEEQTHPEMPAQPLEAESLVEHVQRERGSAFKIFVGIILFAAVALSLWYFG